MTAAAAREAKDHNLVADSAREAVSKGLHYEKRPVKGSDGKPVAGLFNAWITLDNPSQFNSYTTDMVKGTILAFRAASAARDVVAVVFTGAGDKSFCTGGNTKEYAEYYAGNPQEYRGYMRLFNDMVSAILGCDKPVVCRVNGMRIGGGQEIGMACDFSIAQDLARFGQAGPKHGSAPIGGATDFLPYMIGCEQAMVSGLLCEPFSAHKAYRLGIISDIVPALKVDGKFVANPTVTTDRYLDEYGRIVHGEFKTGAAAAEGQALLKRGTHRSQPARREGRGALHQAALHLPRMHDQDRRGTAQAEAHCLERQQRKLARLARPQYDDGRPRGLPRLQRRHARDRAGSRFRGATPRARRQHAVERRAHRQHSAAGEVLVVNQPLKIWHEADGRLLRLRLNRPKANLVDAAMIAALDQALAEHLAKAALGAVLIDAEGPHFSFGASVEEHLPAQCAAMLAGLHKLILRMVESPVPLLMAVRGQCLGGGLELALAGHLIFVTPDANLGQPEMKLGVFAPAASCLLPELIGPARSFDLLVSGRSITGAQAAAIGIAHEAVADPEHAALAYFEEHLKPKSASSLRHAVKAARLDYVARVKDKIRAVERLYLDELMATHDAVAGLEAFIAKRSPQWQHR